MMSCDERAPVVRPINAMAVLFASALWITGCDTADPTAIDPGGSAATHSIVDDRADGVRIYRAVFFGEGPLVRVLPSPWREAGKPRSRAEDASAERFGREILDWIDGSDPTFFADLSAATRSGSHLRVERLLDRASQLTETAFRSVSAEPGRLTLEERSDPDEATGTCIVIAVAYAAVVVKTKLWVAGSERESRAAATSSLGRDQLIHALASSLSTAAKPAATAEGA